MLRGMLICPDAELAQALTVALEETNQVVLVREVDRYQPVVIVSQNM